MNEHDSDFQQLAKDAGIPINDNEIKVAFDKVREESELVITNQSIFSPFWRFVDGIAVQAAKWLVTFLITEILPQAFLKTSSGVFVDMHAWAVDVTRKPITKAQGSVSFIRAQSVGVLDVPAGFIIQSTPINGRVYSLKVLRDITIPDGVLVMAIDVEALEGGSAYNLAAGYYTVMPERIDGLLTVVNLVDWLSVPGSDLESDDELRSRAQNQFTAVNQWHTNAVYTAIIAEFDGVQTNNIYFDNDAPRGSGTADAFVMLEIGTPSNDFIASIQSRITDEGNHGHGDDVLVSAIPQIEYDLTCHVWFPNFFSDDDKATLLENVDQFIRCAFRENTEYTSTKTSPWSLFSFSILSRELHKAFPELANVVFNIDHIESQMWLPKLGALTVTEFESE